MQALVLEFAFMLVVALASLATGFMLVRRYPGRRVQIVALGFVLLGVNILPRVVPHVFYFLFPPYLAFELFYAAAFLLSGALAGAYLDSLFRAMLQVLLFPLMVYFILVPPGYLALHGREILALGSRVRDGVTLQTSSFSCVPSSLATVLRTYGIEHTEGEVALALHTTVLGTDYSRIPRVVRELGAGQHLDVRFVRLPLERLRELGEPGILFVYAGPTRHANALLGFDGDDVIIGEPLRGRMRIPMAEFATIKRWTGLTALVRPDQGP